VSGLEIVDRREHLEPLIERWRELAVRQGNVFLTPDWYLAWLDHYPGEPAVIVIETAGGRLEGLLPLLAEPGGRLRFGGARAGDMFEPVSRPGDEVAVARACGGALARLTANRTLVLDNVRRDGGWPLALVRSSQARLSARAHREATLPWIDLRPFDTWDAFLASKSRNLRSQLRRYHRSIERDHELGFRRSEDFATLESDVDLFFALHDARWDKRGGSSSAGDPIRGFHRSFARAALAQGWLRLWFLELDGEPIAAWYGWLVGGRYAYYLAGFDPASAQRHPGLVLLGHTIRSAIEEGAIEYDMLLGDEHYKSRLASSERRVHTVLVTRRHSLRAAVAAGEARAWRTAQKIEPERRRRLRRALEGTLELLPGSRSR